ncbi:MAG TPA: DUF2442 domain-containing protein [Candidatus Elarobacter sp.]|nr:DUF2442 domain-containing protein [Candidatus Elarobacter sp.]
MPTRAELAEARRRGKEAARVEPRAERISYDTRKKAVVLHLRRGAIVSLPVDRIRWLEGASVRQLRALYADRAGDAIISDELDVHISINGLLSDLIGLTGPAAMMGTAGSDAASPAKAAAAGANGKRGGRLPKKTAA